MAWTRWVVAAAACAVLAAGGAAPATADPLDHVPWCTGNQTPANNNCRASDMPLDEVSPGANPQVPLGVDPQSEPAT